MSYTTYTWANPGTSGTWDLQSNWTYINATGTLETGIAVGTDGGLYPTDDLVLGASGVPYTTYVNAVGTDIIDNLTAGSGVTVQLSPTGAAAHDDQFYFHGTIDIQSGATLNTDSQNSLGSPMEIGYGDPTDSSGVNSEAGSGTMFLDGTMVGSGIIDASVNLIIGNGTIISTVDPRGSSVSTGLTINTNLGGNLTVEAEAGSTIHLGGSVASTVTFRAASAVELDQADQFSGTLSGLSVDTSVAPASLNAANLSSAAPNYVDLVGVSAGGAGNFNGISQVSSAVFVPDASAPTSGGTLEVALTPIGGSPTTLNFNIAGNYTNGSSNTPDAVTIVPDAGNNSTGGAANGGFDGYDLVFTDYTTCFLPGTGILTPSGEVAVENLRPGDQVITVVDGAYLPDAVKWIGYRKLTLDQRAIAAGMAPVRFTRGSMADGLPHRDLLVSPPHCMFLDGKLIPAKLLVNDMTILRETDLSTVEYYHVELGRHAVILANGVTTESYLDTGNRAFFSNAGTALMLHPEFHVNAGLKCWQTDACAPLIVSPEAVQPLWRAFADRAIERGCQPPEFVTTPDADLHLIVDGRRLDSVCVKNRAYSFVVPAGAKSIQLASRSVVPGTLRRYLDDPRQLGVAIRRVIVRGTDSHIDYPADHPAFSRGWHAPERTGSNLWRWTNGAGVLPSTEGKPAVMEIVVSETTEYIMHTVSLALHRLAA